ncbi:hypothetical protein [Nonomuraea typhae]|uniref:hypothetical protein n=1 Tax=Nonomuraea typhae TaxID=2603600 RepID=UPI0012F78964|nr:hypothetical protein [Nonomuraea typhae]
MSAPAEVTAEDVAGWVTEFTGDMDEHLGGVVTVRRRGNTLAIDVTPVDDSLGYDKANAKHFRAVVVEGEQAPIVLESPAELGMEWHDGGDMLALTREGITIFPGGADEWVIPSKQAREMAAQLAAMADAREAAQAETDDDGTCGDCMSGKCHGTEPEECGCARHDVSVEAAQAENGGGA